MPLGCKFADGGADLVVQHRVELAGHGKPPQRCALLDLDGATPFRGAHDLAQGASG